MFFFLPELAQEVVNAGAVPQLVLCLQEAELPLKRIAASTLSEICKHTPELAQIVVDNDAVTYLAPLIQHNDAKLKRHVCGCLAQIAKHNVDLAEVVIEKEVIPKIFNCLKDSDLIVRKHTATCIREIVKHTPELAQAVVNGGGHKHLIDYMMNKDTKGANILPAIMAIGYIAAFSDTLASTIILDQGIPPIKEALAKQGNEDHIKAAAAWALGQIGRHTSEHAKSIAISDVFRHLMEVRSLLFCSVLLCLFFAVPPQFIFFLILSLFLLLLFFFFFFLVFLGLQGLEELS
jgi:3-methyladenine DNA glycosylase AlkD